MPGAAPADHPRPLRHRRAAAWAPDFDALRRAQKAGRFFHGYDNADCCLRRPVFCGRHLLAARLCRADIDGSAGAIAEAARILRQIRARWPRVRVLLRADSGFARAPLMARCEANRVDLLFGLAGNVRLVEEAARTGMPARRFRDFR